MGGNAYKFWILYIDFEIFLITCSEFFSSSQDLLEITRLVFDQFNPFWDCYSMPIQNQMAKVKRKKLQNGSSTSQERAT